MQRDTRFLRHVSLDVLWYALALSRAFRYLPPCALCKRKYVVSLSSSAAAVEVSTRKAGELKVATGIFLKVPEAGPHSLVSQVWKDCCGIETERRNHRGVPSSRDTGSRDVCGPISTLSSFPYRKDIASISTKRRHAKVQSDEVPIGSLFPDHTCVRCPSSHTSHHSGFGCSTSRRHG